MECAFFLDVVVTEGAAIFQLLSSKDEPLLIWGDSFFILDFGFHIFNSVTWLNLKSNGLAGKGLYEDLHASSQSQDKVECAFFLDVVVTEGAAIFQLLSSKDEPLLIWGDSFFILNFGFHIFNSVTWLNLKSNGLASKGLNEDLHTSSQSQDQVKCAFFLDVVVAEGAAIFQLFSSKDEPLLIWGDSFFILDFGLHIFDSVTWLNLKSNGLASKGLYKDLHATNERNNAIKVQYLE